MLVKLEKLTCALDSVGKASSLLSDADGASWDTLEVLESLVTSSVLQEASWNLVFKHEEVCLVQIINLSPKVYWNTVVETEMMLIR